MAKTEKRVREGLGSSSYFLGCFGFSRKIYSDKPMVTKGDGGEKKKMKKKRIPRWFLCSKFRLKNSEIKPSPIEETEKPTSRVEDETDDKQKPLSVIRRITDRKNIPVDDKAMNQETKETKPKDLRDITPDRSKPIEPLGSFKEDTCTERISSISSRYGKPDLKPTRSRNGSRVKPFDPVIGISIIILTLMIMLVWGRLCAILCTSAWCYVLPRVRDAAALAKRKRNGSASVPDLNSESYKRKVVLDGFLGRQNRVSLS
ncbi:hypothetical protein AtNW77_Chr5g0091841 [Arabidopsis thaliana]|jgi:hypothetical protein|uniref:Transmembrane protein n=4 Tax=Arabidopsis TaxID=3701 RepID=A0A178URN4_ARATH|nr:uncharacterized protein AT5G08240 [Arabidopsis thaliana]KAG7601594.1 hypothetical protein ISN45_At05g007510 [Arabidopsis thaliana x Arabidopsis arenosa]KAG7608531.1 hypothetical protein ISN44_As05g007510 [Arabidopsis suecica]ABH04460.1 At5g08240 [Arabidopsis thaliana]AED91273.1 transmembrane protein [Arabidopsis thaliana]OAO95572.1 hypothetical protein AXX17_AT5G08030 [Arabidopsis thaliana]|eukprot:NP_196441.1 transmembrane protein [Arabidopsis thaliana]